MLHFVIENIKYLPFDREDKASQITGMYIKRITIAVQNLIRLLVLLPCAVYSIISSYALPISLSRSIFLKAYRVNAPISIVSITARAAPCGQFCENVN